MPDERIQSGARAFNLLEVAVASAMAGIIAVAAISSFAVLNRQLVKLQAESGASDDAKTLIDFLVTDLQAVGGGSVRPWMALWIEDGGDPASTARCTNFGQTGCGTPQSSDRITYALVVPDSRTCPITAMNPTHIFSDTSGSTCCLSRLADDDRGGYLDGTDVKMHVVAINGASSRQISLSDFNPGGGLTACSMKYLPGPLAGIDNADGDALLDSVDPSVTATSLVGGTVSAVAIRTIYLNQATKELFAFEEKRDFNGVDVDVKPDERKRVASNVHDLQVQLGYDGNPADGRLVDLGTTTDEWLYNAPSDTLSGGLTFDDLRMAAVGVVVGVNVKDPNYTSSSAQVVGGGVKNVPGVHMRSGMGKAALRNVFVFF